jgi:hypothetical protein
VKAARPKEAQLAIVKKGTRKGSVKQTDSRPELLEMPGDTVAADVAKAFGVSPGWLYLTIKRPEQYPVGPIALGPAETVINVEKFAEITIKDVIEAIHQQNRGHLRHWAVSLIEKKIEKLAICGVEVEIRSIV